MRLSHAAGERMFVDFSGDKAHYVDAATGEIVEAEVFVAVLGCSGLLYAEATRSQGAVEAGVLSVERWVLAPLRHRRLIGLGELNAAIGEQVAALNARPFRGEPASRADLFE